MTDLEDKEEFEHGRGKLRQYRIDNRSKAMAQHLWGNRLLYSEEEREAILRIALGPVAADPCLEAGDVPGGDEEAADGHTRAGNGDTWVQPPLWGDASVPVAGNGQERVNHPSHYGGDTTYEVIKVLEAWGLVNDFLLGNAIKYIARADKKGNQIEDLEKALWYVQRKIDNIKKEQS